MRSERRAQVLDPSALRSHPRQEKDGVRHQLAQASEQAGLRGAGDRPD